VAQRFAGARPPSHPVSALLSKWRAGNHEALQALIPVVYEELRRIARHHLRQERPDHTLQSTALVHEAYLRLMKQGPAEVVEPLGWQQLFEEGYQAGLSR